MWRNYVFFTVSVHDGFASCFSAYEARPYNIRLEQSDLSHGDEKMEEGLGVFYFHHASPSKGFISSIRLEVGEETFSVQTFKPSQWMS